MGGIYGGYTSNACNTVTTGSEWALAAWGPLVTELKFCLYTPSFAPNGFADAYCGGLGGGSYVIWTWPGGLKVRYSGTTKP
jgi:hypothetical protein